MEEGTQNGENFPAFPYPPYDIQLGLMRALYKALDEGGVGLFESPTGTGKTLSLICGSLHWLQDMRERERAEAEARAPAPSETEAGEDDVPDWMRDFSSQQEDKMKKLAEEQRAARIAKAKAKLVPKQQQPHQQQQRDVAPRTDNSKGDDPESEFLLDEVVEGLEGSGAPKTGLKRAALLSDSDDSDADSDLWAAGEGEELEPPKKTQIIFCSRTHSQLTQFVGELHRTPFADSLSLVALGSRRALCINDAVLRLKSPGLINERCLELQKPSTSKKKAAGENTATITGTSAAAASKPVASKSSSNCKRCPFLGAGSKSADIVRDMILAQPVDIEELAVLGRRRSVCPYYASRRVAPEADIVLAPYSALLVAETREALGLRVEGSVIIVDEAHNLVDAINGSHSAELPASYASAAQHQLLGYFERFRTRLAPGNARNVQALVRAASALAAAANGLGLLSRSQSASQAATGLGPPSIGGGGGAKAYTVNDFLFATGLDNVNVFQLVRYARNSKAVFKIAGFWQSVQAKKEPDNSKNTSKSLLDDKDKDAQNPEGATGVLHALISFLQALTNEDTDGRVIVNPESGTVKYVLLNAATHFAQVASSARAIILASGTLSPLEPVLQLFPDIALESFHKYSCGHVVGKERLLAIAVGSGPSGTPFDFRHAARGTHATIDELGRLLTNVCTCTPGGVVVFFPSFSYADQVHARWSSTGALTAMGAKKKVFREPRTAGEVESVLGEYGKCVREGPGSVLLCVVGGKLAEGINFGDALGRCVVMVGLPYPNPSDPELQERLKFIDRTLGGGGGGGMSSQHTGGGGGGQGSGGTQASREHYLNLCMKAVNQCVGRAIRHRQDYAAVLLVDSRYASSGGSGSSSSSSGTTGQLTGPAAKLPGWIQQSLVVSKGFGGAYGKLVRFYKGMQATEEAPAVPAAV